MIISRATTSSERLDLTVFRSAALPEKEITSPTFHVVVAEGVAIVAVGYASSVVMTIESISDRP